LTKPKFGVEVVHVDPLTDYFIQRMDETSLINLEHNKGSPTWRNKRIVVDSIAKMINIFILSKGFVNDQYKIRQWVGFDGDSNHFPIFWK
jgi:hypothetical protein